MTEINVLVQNKINSMEISDGMKEDLIEIIRIEGMLGDTNDEKNARNRNALKSSVQGVPDENIQSRD